MEQRRERPKGAHRRWGAMSCGGAVAQQANGGGWWWSSQCRKLGDDGEGRAKRTGRDERETDVERETYGRRGLCSRWWTYAEEEVRQRAGAVASRRGRQRNTDGEEGIGRVCAGVGKKKRGKFQASVLNCTYTASV